MFLKWKCSSNSQTGTNFFEVSQRKNGQLYTFFNYPYTKSGEYLPIHYFYDEVTLFGGTPSSVTYF